MFEEQCGPGFMNNFRCDEQLDGVKLVQPGTTDGELERLLYNTFYS